MLLLWLCLGCFFFWGVCFCFGCTSDVSGVAMFFAVPLRGAQLSVVRKLAKNVAKGAKSGLIGGVADKVALYRCSVAFPFFGFVRTAQIKSEILSATAPKHSHTYVCSKFLNSECEQGNRCNSEFTPWFALQNQSGFSACDRLCHYRSLKWA